MAKIVDNEFDTETEHVHGPDCMDVAGLMGPNGEVINASEIPAELRERMQAVMKEVIGVVGAPTAQAKSVEQLTWNLVRGFLTDDTEEQHKTITDICDGPVLASKVLIKLGRALAESIRAVDPDEDDVDVMAVRWEKWVAEQTAE